jgi:hypothetical protein
MLIHTAARAAASATGRRANRTRIGYAVLDALAERFNRGKVTAGQYLIQVLGTDAEFAAKYDSPFGKAIKKAYIALHDAEPAKLRLAAVGTRLHRKIGYLLGEPALELATRTYARTAALIGA